MKSWYEKRQEIRLENHKHNQAIICIPWRDIKKTQQQQTQKSELFVLIENERESARQNKNGNRHKRTKKTKQIKC